MEPVQAMPLESITRDLLASQLVAMQAFDVISGAHS